MKRNAHNLPYALGALLVMGVLPGCSTAGSSTSSKTAPMEKSFAFGNMSGRAALTNPPLFASGRGVSSLALTGQINSLELRGLPRTLANTRILFASGRTSSLNGGVFTMLPDGSSQSIISPSVIAIGEASWSPDGKKIAFYKSSQIWTMNVEGGPATQLTFSAGLNISPAWSPDGNKIAFTSKRDGNNEIYVMNADGTGQTRLTVNAGNDQHPAWSPDGNKIAFESDRDGTIHIYTMTNTGASPIRLTNTAGLDQNPAWSPDGGTIAFDSTRDGGLPELYKMDTGGNLVTRLTTNAFSDSSPCWSPDGTTLAFSSRRNNNTDVYTYSVATGIETRLTNHPEVDDRPTWSPFLTQRAFVGANGILSNQASGVIYSAAGDMPTSIVAFSTSDFSQLKVTLGNSQETAGAWLTYVLEGSNSPISFTGFRLWNLTEASPASITLGDASITGAIVQISATTGKVLLVLPYAAPSRAAGDAPHPAITTQGGQNVWRGTFRGVYDSTGQNLAPSGAHEVQVESTTGKVLSIR